MPVAVPAWRVQTAGLSIGKPALDTRDSDIGYGVSVAAGAYVTFSLSLAARGTEVVLSVTAFISLVFPPSHCRLQNIVSTGP